MRLESASSSVHAPPAPRGTWRRTSTGTGTPSPMGSSSTPSPPEEAPTPSGTRAARPSLSGTRSPIPAHGGPSGSTHPSASPGTSTHWTSRRTGPGRSSPVRSVPRARVLSPSTLVTTPWMRPPWPGAGPWWGSRATPPFVPAHLMDAGDVISSYHEPWHARAVLRR